MTLIVALGCKDGVIVGSDSAATDASAGTKQAIDNKIKQLRDYPILYGGSGDVGLLQSIDEELSTIDFNVMNRKRIRQTLKKAIVTQFEESNTLHAPYPVQPYNLPPRATFLFAGVLAGAPWVLEFEIDGRETYYGDNFGHFAAIGSGKPWAQAIFRPHLFTERDLNLGQVFVHRILEDSISLAATGLSEPIHMRQIRQDGTVESIDAVKLKELIGTCNAWRTLEQEAVGKLLANASTIDKCKGVQKPILDDSEVIVIPEASMTDIQNVRGNAPPCVPPDAARYA